MNKKIICIFLMMLFIATAVLPNTSSSVLDSKIIETNALKSVPKMTDNSGKTTFRGLFVGVPFAKEAQDLADSLSGKPGWNPKNMTILKNENVTAKNVTDALTQLKSKSKSGDEVVIYFGVHGGDNLPSAKDGTRGYKKDNESNGYDNHIYLYDWVSVTDDQLSDLISGFDDCVTITVIIDSCYSGTFTDGDDDLQNATDGWGDIYDKDHLYLMLSSEDKAPTRKKGVTYTDRIIDGLKTEGSSTKADKNKDGNTTSKEMKDYVNSYIVEHYTGDNDNDGLVDEDVLDYYQDPNTGEVKFLEIDNDGDGLIDEDIHPPKPNFCYRDSYIVNDDGGGDFINIQDAINAIEPGGIILIEPGIYNEQVIVDKEGIVLKSTSIGFSTQEQTIIEWPQGSVLKIQSPHTEITGLTIRNCGTNEQDAAIEIISNYNIIGWNNIEDNRASGVYLHSSSNYNYIHHNIIKNNDGAGIFIWEQSTNNWIYHNDFINNGWYNVKDKEGGNFWNYLSTFGGNYWDDYTGVDTNGDGIGETPYDIMGDYQPTGQDNYPWIEPHRWNKHPKKPTITGKTNGKAGEEYEYEFELTEENFGPGSDPFDDLIYCTVDWGDGNTENIGPKKPGSIAFKSHRWDEEGKYTIQAMLTDSYGAESEWATLEVNMPRNRVKSIPFFSFLQQYPFIYTLLQKFIKF